MISTIWSYLLRCVCSCFGTTPNDKASSSSERKTIMPQDASPSFALQGFHYDGKELFWCEWVTLYFYGPKDGIDGMINYIFIKTVHDLGIGLLYPAIVIHDVEQRENGMDTYYASDIRTRKDRIDIGLRNNVFYQADDEGNIFIVKGGLNNGNLKWDLYVRRPEAELATKPLVVADKVPLHNEQYVSMVSAMPCGTCKGTVERNGELYRVDGFGEVEHLWGPVVLNTLTWVLAHGYNGNGVGLYWLHVPHIKKMFVSKEEEVTDSPESYGCLRLVVHDKVYKWYTDQYQIEYAFANDKPYPIKTVLKMSNALVTIHALSISASEPSSASENHARVHVLLHDNTDSASKRSSKKQQEYIFYGMFEYSKFGGKQFVNRIHELLNRVVE